MNGVWTAVLGWGLAGAGAAAAVPQIVHLVRTRRVEGLSPTTELMWVPSWALWLWYVIDMGIGPRMLSEGLGLVMSLGIVSLLLTGLARAGGARSAVRTAAPLLALSVVTVLVSRWVWGLDGMAIALTAVDMCALVPMVRTTLTAPSLAGVSVWAWVFKLATYVGWITFAVAISEPLSAGWMYLMAPIAVFMLTRLAMDRGLAARVRRRGVTVPWLGPGVEVLARAVRWRPVRAGVDRGQPSA